MGLFKEFFEMSRWKASTWTPPSKDAMQRLKKYKTGGYYATFTTMKDKLGINPQPRDATTPYGIYAYPVPYILYKHITELPLAGESPYIWVFKPKNPKRIIKISDEGDAAWKHWMKASPDTWAYEPKVGDMNKYFRKKNIQGVVDQSTGTIHPHEPTQAVFFGSNNIEPIEVIDNNYADKFVGNSLALSDEEF